MKGSQKIAALVLLAAAGAAGYGIFRLGRPASANSTGNTKKSTAQTAPLVDQSPLQAAQQLAQLADTPDEQAVAKDALAEANREVDAAFAQALWQAKYYAPPLSAEAKQIQARLQQAQKSLETDQQRVKNLTAAEAKASGTRKDAIDDEIALVNSQVELDQDEVNDAQQDLIRAGGDPHGRIQQMQQERQETRAVSVGTAAPAIEERGLINRFQQWSALRTKTLLLTKAKSDALTAAAVLSEQHDDLEAETDAEKYNSPVLASHSSLAQTQDAASGGQPPASPGTPASSTLNPQEAAALIAQTKRIAANQQNLASFDKRIDAQKDLADTYTQWISLVEARQNNVSRRILFRLLIILVIALLGLFFNTWLESVLEKLHLDRRQIQTLRAIGRVSLQVVSVLFVLLIIFGPPSQLGTVLGLAGAGLTVALKDFIVSFIGWFVLMGKNGIRLGDWVEINGVTGEVVEIGLFHTVLLETGNWTDSGHPTGRRVTFTNSFATAGHYFNFSTSGQWLWDEVQLILPSGEDPYPLIDAIQKTVEQATESTAAKAQEEWKRSVRSRDMGTISVAPALSLKPVPGGIEVTVRYITRANERHILRAQIYQEIVNILGGRPMAPPTAA
ncbi:MAG TPA: mechanosensitive ion channel domain-containing protein [Terriglobales bacterium]|nr:mechanosensitive ion channel domain-containing protein [Terriglobales bacterium]